LKPQLEPKKEQLTMRVKVYYICAVLLMLSLSTPAVFAQDAQADKLLGWWLFDSEKDEIRASGWMVAI
jgi:hypothetical protein